MESTGQAMIALAPLFHLDVEVGPIMSFGAAPYGERRVVPIIGGQLLAPDFSGTIVPGGADWQILRADGVLDIEARYSVKTGSGDLIEVLSQGYRFGPPEILARMARGESVPADSYYFRSTMRFQTGSADLSYLNRTLAIARGEREANWVRLDVDRIL